MEAHDRPTWVERRILRHIEVFIEQRGCLSLERSEYAPNSLPFIQ